MQKTLLSTTSTTAHRVFPTMHNPRMQETLSLSTTSTTVHRVFLTMLNLRSSEISKCQKNPAVPAIAAL